MADGGLEGGGLGGGAGVVGYGAFGDAGGWGDVGVVGDVVALWGRWHLLARTGVYTVGRGILRWKHILVNLGLVGDNLLGLGGHGIAKLGVLDRCRGNISCNIFEPLESGYLSLLDTS